MVVSDTTGNVKKTRALIVSKWPWILNCPDPCHGLNLMMKDIMMGSKTFPKIGAFTQVSLEFGLITSITTYFSHSNQGTHHLKEEMKQEKDKRGIEVAGVTRFSTFFTPPVYPVVLRVYEGAILKGQSNSTQQL